MTAAIAATTATAAAMMIVRRGFPRRACLDGPGPDPTAGNWAVEGSDAYHGPDDLLPLESSVTHATVPDQVKYETRKPAPISPVALCPA
jgi:hypothetical protein